MARKKKVQADELSELDSAYEKMVGQQATRKKKSPALLIVTLSLLLVAILGVGIWLLFSDHWLIMKDVTVAGIPMEGMTKKDAKTTLSQLVDDLYGKETMTVTIMDTTLELDAKGAGIEIDTDAAINAAYGCTGVFDLAPYITVTGDGLDAMLNIFGKEFNADLQPTVYTVEGDVPALNTAEADSNGQILKLELGKPELGLDLEELRAKIMAAYGTATFSLTAECKMIPPEMPTAEELYQKYLTAPVNAVMDEKTFIITPEVYGYSVDPQQAAQLLATAQYGDTLQIPFAKVTPEVTEEDILATLFQDVLGECSTPYSGADNNSRNTNLRLACEKINGLILMPGDTFSYNNTLGERTAENGWKPAASYVNGLTVDTYGGGICQGSSTLYNCVLQADFKLVECFPHGYISAYTDPGMDATVDWGSVDFKFTNTSNYPIKLEAYRRDGKMTMRIYGTDEKDYYVKMTYKVLSTKAFETVYEEIDPSNNPKGYRDEQELVSPYTGFRVVTYKNKYSKATNELIETTQERDVIYKHRDRVVVKFVSPDTPPATP